MMTGVRSGIGLIHGIELLDFVNYASDLEHLAAFIEWMTAEMKAHFEKIKSGSWPR
jgi:hypothetical protein